ncbi:MAG: hypothetical protein JWQ78_39 [Sediminibacterium sp.]|nr:hypothetical protein [Sediminibacterium sp.]
MQFRALIKPLLVAAFIAETLCVTYALKFPAWIPTASVVYFLSGLLIAVLTVCLPQVRLRLPTLLKTIRTGGLIKILLAGLLAVALYHFTRAWIAGTPLTIYDADMLPIMKVMAQRFLQGQWSQVYDPIPEIWGGIQPIYLPAMWLPFTIAVAGNFDLRWITTAGLFFSFAIFLALLEPFKKIFLSLLLFLCSYFLLRWLLTEEMHNFIRLSEEGLVVFYYSLLVLALLSENFLLIGIAAALCALSRYTLAGWFPAMIIYLLLRDRQQKKLLTFAIAGLSMVLLLVILPFGWHVLEAALALPSQYIGHANRVWTDSPEFFYESMGFAKFFGPGRTHLLHRVLIIASFAGPILFVLVCRLWEYVTKNTLGNIPLGCLKLSVVIVYTFLDVPYLYLFYTSSFVSLVAIAWLINAPSPSIGKDTAADSQITVF